MIVDQQNGRKQTGAAKPEYNLATTSGEKVYTTADRAVVTINPELDKFSGGEYMPDKQKEAEIRLAKSILLPFK